MGSDLSIWRFLFLVLWMLASLVGTPSTGWSQEPSIQKLITEATHQELARHSYWLRLLRYHAPGETLLQWSTSSDVRSPSFFNSPQGATDPQAELEATLRAFFLPVKEDPNQHAQCRFVARFQWLQTQLTFPETLRQVECPLYERWSNRNQVKSISLIFASAFMGNPASIYGHLLMKVNFEEGLFAHSLLSPTFNFGAQLEPGDNALEYALKGLFGGYFARFTDERFYNYNHVYGETELRDLWEYELNLDAQQRQRVIAHAWELLQGVDFTYYFFRSNCAFQMSELLDMAWDKPRMRPEFSMWAMPTTQFFKITELENNGESLVRDIRLIPSRQRRLRQRVRSLSPGMQQELLRLIENPERLQDPAFSKKTGTDQAALLDAMIDYNQYQASQNETFLSPDQKQQLLVQRSQLPRGVPLEVDAYPVKPPTEGTPPGRLRFGFVHNTELENALELGAHPSYHDLLGREDGHLPNADLITFDFRLRLSRDEVVLRQLELLNIRSLKVSPTGLPLDSGWSWQFRGGLEPRDLECSRCRVFHVSGGFGKASPIAASQKMIGYAFVHAFTKISEEFEYDYTAGLRPSIGLIFYPVTGWKSEVQWSYLGGFAGEIVAEHQVEWNHRWNVTTDWEARFEFRYHEASEALLGMHYYW